MHVNLQKMVELAKADLAGRKGEDAGRIELIAAELVTWPDGSLGCPEPGMMYTQALVEGVLIRLSLDGREYEYHGGRKGAPFLCDPVPDGRGPLPAGDV